MKDLGLQTLQAIRSSSDPISKMTDLLHNFPQRASALSAMKVQGKVRDDMNLWWNTGISRMLHRDAVYVNGVKIDLEGATFNVFDFFATSKW